MSEVATKMRMKADLEKGDVIIQCSPRASAAKGGDDDGKSVGKEEREESCRSTNAQNMGKRDEEQVDPDNSFYEIIDSYAGIPWATIIDKNYNIVDLMKIC